MGLLIQTSFETLEGIPVTNVYSKLTGITCDFLSKTEVRVLIKHETFVSREKRLQGARSLKTPGVPEYIVINVPPSDAWGTHEYLYAALKTSLKESGIVVEDVIEAPEPTPEPAPEPAPEPTPEPTPEPAPEASNTENA